MKAAFDDEQPMPQRGQVWVRNADGREVVAMSSPIDSYVMLRVPRCIPFVEHVNELFRQYTRKF